MSSSPPAPPEPGDAPGGRLAITTWGPDLFAPLQQAFWEAARLYPEAASGLPLTLDDRTRGLLGLFA